MIKNFQKNFKVLMQHIKKYMEKNGYSIMLNIGMKQPFLYMKVIHILAKNVQIIKIGLDMAE